jgi:hypothetical protein
MHILVDTGLLEYDDMMGVLVAPMERSRQIVTQGEQLAKLELCKLK